MTKRDKPKPFIIKNAKSVEERLVEIAQGKNDTYSRSEILVNIMMYEEQYSRF